MNSQNAYNIYQQTHSKVESQPKLIEMLYEGILRFSSLAKKGIERGDIEKKIYYINRTTDIFTELLNVLDYENGGDVAHYLTGLYMQQIKFLTQANVENNIESTETQVQNSNESSN